jgi:PAS domain S-box-containing protein
MATSPDFVRVGNGATRALAETAFDALREAIIVVDARQGHLPLVMANAAARNCLQVEGYPAALLSSSLYSLLGHSTDAAIQSVLNLKAHAGEECRTHRVLRWRLADNEVSIPTDLKLLNAGPGQRLVLLSFTEPASKHEPFTSGDPLPLDLVILDKNLMVTHANAGASRTAGITDGGLLSHSALSLLPTSGIARHEFQRVLDGGHYHDEVAATMPHGTSPARWFEVDMQPLKDSAGIVGIAVVWRDVTERHKTKLAALEIKPPWLALTEYARDIITVATRDGRLQFISGGIKNSLGYSTEERRSQSVFEHVHPEDADELRGRFAQLVDGVTARFSHQYRIRHKDGSYRWLESHYVSALTNPLIRGVVINSRDVTERRQVEHQLAQREEIFRLAADAVNGIIFEWDLARGVVHRSRGVHEVLGIEPEELAVEGAWSARVHPQDDPVYRQDIRTALRGDANGWTVTYRIRDARGVYRSMLERALIQRSPDGVPVRAIGCCMDVSEIKRLTDLLTETQRAATMGGWEYSYALDELTWTDEMFRIYETHPGGFAVSWDGMLDRFKPESRLRLTEACRVAEEQGGGFDLELEITTLKNRPLWVRVIGHVEKLDGRPLRSFGSVQNVQVQKLAQIALSNSTDWLKLSMNMANLHAWRWDRKNDTLEFANVDPELVNLPRVFPGMQNLIARVHPKDRLAVRRAIDQAFASRAEVHAEFRLKSASGQYRSFAAIARPLIDATNELSGLVGVTQDVTARHESEARLRRSEELLRATTTNTADTLLLLDTSLRVRFINRPIRGMSIESMVGEQIGQLIPESNRDAVLTKLRRVLMTTEPAHYEIFYTTNGITQYFENRAVLVRDDGIGTGISITVRNITERKRLEQEILDVSSRERQTIGRDLHDGLGQELTGVALMLRGLAGRIQRQAPESVDHVNEIVRLVNQSIETARSLARGLLPVNTENGGLSFALRELAARSGEIYGFAVHFREDISPGLTLSEASASHLYRIAQEALTNSARHGCASEAAIYLRFSQDHLLLEITDNGKGIEQTERSALGMGLKIMRYRASMIGARFAIFPNLPRGTVVRVTGEQPILMSTLHSAHAI